MSFTTLLMLCLTIFASSMGQFCLKMGAAKLGKLEGGNVVTMVLGMATNWHILTGLVFYALGVVSYVLLLSQVNLSIAGPAMTVSYVIGIMMGVIFFKETLQLPQYVAIAMILTGVVMLVQGKVPQT
jgi:multidrug transporter EmrE-like cation transporter